MEVSRMSQYNENTILNMCEDAMENPALFYTQNFVNYKGICPDAQDYYTEVIAKYLINHLSTFSNGIPQIKRRSSYYTQSHKGEYNPNSNRKEEITAIKIFSSNGNQYEKIGKILDYQIPLKDKQNDHVGKIDLLAYDGNVLHVLELKVPKKSEETMLRCVLEGYTYLQTVDTAKLIADFNSGCNLDIPTDTPVKASPFVFENSLPYHEYFENRPNLKELMKRLNSEPFFIREISGGYEVV